MRTLLRSNTPALVVLKSADCAHLQTPRERGHCQLFMAIGDGILKSSSTSGTSSFPRPVLGLAGGGAAAFGPFGVAEPTWCQAAAPQPSSLLPWPPHHPVPHAEMCRYPPFLGDTLLYPLPLSNPFLSSVAAPFDFCTSHRPCPSLALSPWSRLCPSSCSMT